MIISLALLIIISIKHLNHVISFNTAIYQHLAKMHSSSEYPSLVKTLQVRSAKRSQVENSTIFSFSCLTSPTERKVVLGGDGDGDGGVSIGGCGFSTMPGLALCTTHLRRKLSFMKLTLAASASEFGEIVVGVMLADGAR